MKILVFLLKGVRLSVRPALLPILALSLLLLMYPVGLCAQGLSGITGTVTDSTGAVVPEAKVTATNTATGVATHAVTTSFGTYTITDLIPGTYTVTIEKSGFSKRVISGVYVDVSRTTAADANLAMGTATETVEVVSEQISLETTQPQLGTFIENKITEEVPVIIGGGPGNIGPRDRQIDDYLFLAPGVQGGEFSHRINGGVDFQNEVMFNGVAAVQSETQGMQSNINPPFEMVGEIQVLTSNFGAQYGMAQGVASYQFASGTNSLHGDVFDVVRNTIFDAAGANPGWTNGVKNPAPSINQNNYGFTLGGPVWIPKLYNGKNKTFFHFSSDWFRQNLADTATMTVPTQAMVGGDFSGLPTGDTIFVPQGFVAPAGCTAPAPGQQWPGNKIPTACFSQNSASLLPLIPTPVLPGLSNNMDSTVGVIPTRQTNWGFSIDHNLTDKQKLHGSFWRDNYNFPSCCDNNAHFNNALSGEKSEPRLGTGLFLTYSNAFSSHLVMTAGFGWMGEINSEYNSHTNVSFPGAASSDVLPTINFNQNGLPNGPTNWGVNSAGETFSINRKLGLSFDNNWLWSHGRHTFNIGWEIRKSFQDDHECQQCGGGFTFSNYTTGDPTNFQQTGNAFASFLLGYADSATRAFALNNKLRNFYIAPYIQDDIKVTPKLTVNFGVRWDVMVPFTELNNDVVFFDPLLANTAAVTPGGTPLLGAANSLGPVAGYNRADVKLNHFGPRVGIAYSVNKKTVILSGFTWNFLDGGAYEYGDNKLSVQYGLLGGLYTVNSFGSNVPHYGQWDSNPIPVPAALPFSPTNWNATGALREFSKDPGAYPYTESWNAGVQRELPGNWFLSVAYIGNKSVHLPSMLNPLNQTNPKYLTEFCPSANPSDPNCPMSPGSPNFAWTSAVSQADLQSAGFGLCPTGTPSAGLYAPYCNFMNDYGSGAGLSQALLPYPMYNASESAGGLANPFDMNGTALYNAMQVQAQKRYSNGLTFLVTYTLSKTMSNTDTGFATFNYGSLNGYNQKSEWSIAGNDQTHLLNITTVYELPIGPGKKLLNKGGLVAKNLIGGWQVSGGFAYASGMPISVYAYDNNPFLNGFNRANYNPQTPLDVNYNNYYKGLPVFTQAAFSDPGFAAGNAPRVLSTLRNPFASNENFALAKHFYFSEHVTAELRMEFFNVLNRMQVCGPDTNVADGTNNFGFVSPSGNGAGPGGSNPCQGNAPRQGQAVFKISF